MINPRPSYPMWLLALLLALIGLVFFTVPAFACGGIVMCVDDNAPAGGNGQSWGTAYKYLQDALTAATSGNEIWVAEGVYYPDEGAGQTARDHTRRRALGEELRHWPREVEMPLGETGQAGHQKQNGNGK